jgi:2-iminobutanoate/2-iminopropanoate deaminase
MPALDADGKFIPGTFEEEANRAWASIVAITAASGYSPGNFLYVQVLLGDIANYGDINDWWRRQFPDPAKAPARLTFQAGALPFGAKIELQAVAAAPDPAAWQRNRQCLAIMALATSTATLAGHPRQA